MENADLSGPTAEELNRPGLVVLDIRNDASPVVTLGGEIVVDARDKITPASPKGWADRKESAKYSSIIRAVRTAFASGDGPGGMQKALLDAAKKLNISANEALIVGEAPEHWKPTTHIAARYRRR